MNFASKTQHNSEATPGVSYTLKKLSHGRRVRIDLALCDHRARVRELAKEFAAIPEADTSEDARLARLKLDQKTRLVIEEHFKPAYLREALASIEGLEIDGEPATLETLFSDGPAELVEEIYQAIQRGINLSVDDAKN